MTGTPGYSCIFNALFVCWVDWVVKLLTYISPRLPGPRWLRWPRRPGTLSGWADNLPIFCTLLCSPRLGRYSHCSDSHSNLTRLEVLIKHSVQLGNFNFHRSSSVLKCDSPRVDPADWPSKSDCSHLPPPRRGRSVPGPGKTSVLGVEWGASAIVPLLTFHTVRITGQGTPRTNRYYLDASPAEIINSITILEDRREKIVTNYTNKAKLGRIT